MNQRVPNVQIGLKTQSSGQRVDAPPVPSASELGEQLREKWEGEMVGEDAGRERVTAEEAERLVRPAEGDIGSEDDVGEEGVGVVDAGEEGNGERDRGRASTERLDGAASGEAVESEARYDELREGLGEWRCCGAAG